MQEKINKVIVIAEAGVNHNGDLQLAKEMVIAAKSTGADYIKFQTAVAELVISKFAQKADYQLKSTDINESQLEMCRKIHLSIADYAPLKRYCDQVGIKFLSTPFDMVSIGVLENLDMDYFKIPSGEITNLPYLRYIGRLGKPVILSTGMATLGDIEAAIEVLEQAGTARSNLTLLHCTTEYPAPMAEVNLRAMQSMQSTFGVAVGYSDHSQGIEVAVAAVALGATVIEKHFTLDRNLPGPDHKASLEPEELRNMVAAIRNIEVALGDGIKRLTPSEARNKPVARKSLVASKAIKAGELFSAQNVTAKRPGTGISPMCWDDIIGQAALKDYVEDDLL